MSASSAAAQVRASLGQHPLHGARVWTVRVPAGRPLPRSKRDHWQLLIGARGALRVAVGDRSFRLAPGIALCLPPVRPATITAEHDGELTSIDFFIHPLGPGPTPLSALALPDSARIADLRAGTPLAALLDQARRAQARQGTLLANAVAGLVLDAFLAAATTPEAGAGPAWLPGVLDHVSRRLAYPQLSVAEIARQFGLSRPYLSRAFRRAQGVALGDYLRASRLRLARSLLANQGDHSVAEVARRCGFRSASQFCRVFSRSHAATPGAWRRRSGG